MVIDNRSMNVMAGWRFLCRDGVGQQLILSDHLSRSLMGSSPLREGDQWVEV